jgi:preprotein translocase subunit SecG
MYGFVVLIHIIASIFLILVILLQAGKGSGLSDSFGSSQMQNMFGTKSTSVLTRLTTVSAVVFIFTCLSLAIISSHNAKSLVDRVNMPRQPMKSTAPIESKNIPNEIPKDTANNGNTQDSSAPKTETAQPVATEPVK